VSEGAPVPLRLPTEEDDAGGHWVGRVVRTLAMVLARPLGAFEEVREPVRHAKVLRYLAILRLPPWAVLIVLFGARLLTAEGPAPVQSLPIHAYVDPALVGALSTWLLLMIPVGLPMLYFFSGLVAHVGIALTGGAPRSIGATLRAVGYALGPALLAIGLLDIPLYLRVLPPAIHRIVLLVFAVQFLIWSGMVVARSHRISWIRGLVVCIPPTLLLLSVSAARAALEWTDLLGVAPPASPYFVP
jgi:hypothetical protein